jgi:glutamine amidotransferase
MESRALFLRSGGTSRATYALDASSWYAADVRIVVCDVGLGNLRSVERGLREASREARQGNVVVEVTQDPVTVRAADKLVMPGQSAFGDYARALSGDLGQAVREHLRAGRPYLGICMGLQVLFESSEEAPDCPGLGVLEGRVVRLKAGVDPATGAPFKVPHMGWNEVETTGNPGLLERGKALHFYFVHSFVVVPTSRHVVAATTDYGAQFVSAIAYENVFACQFHPEKSQRAGLALLQRFVSL